MKKVVLFLALLLSLRAESWDSLKFLEGEWAATGNVTYPIPDDFPSADGIKMRPSTEPK